MAKTELKLKTTNAATGQNITTTVGYVNPTADSQTLKTFGQKLNAFTTNTYEETDRVQTINVDTETIKQWRNMTANNISQGSSSAYITYNSKSGSTNTPFVVFDSGSGETANVLTTTFEQGATATEGKAKFTVPNYAGTLYAVFIGGTSFYADALMVTVE